MTKIDSTILVEKLDQINSALEEIDNYKKEYLSFNMELEDIEVEHF
jgi:hypothetical protein